MLKISEVPIDKIKVGGHEQRMASEDEGTDELAESIRRVGVLVPLILNADGVDFLLVAGHRRLVAAKAAGLTAVPAIIREIGKAEAMEITFAENFFRKDLSPVELSCAIKGCIDSKGQTVSDLAAGFKRSETWIHKMIAVAGWPGDVLAEVHAGSISLSAASNIALVEDETYRIFLLSNAVDQGATARTTAAWLQAWRGMMPAAAAVNVEPVPPGQAQVPMVPQAPCFCCGQLFKVNEMSHVPVCGACVQIVRQISQTNN